jgi:hypothetical protein
MQISNLQFAFGNLQWAGMIRERVGASSPAIPEPNQAG